MRPNILTAGLGVILGLSLLANPAEAQGKGNAKKQGGASRPRVEQIDDRVYDERGRTDDYGYGRVSGRGNGSGKVPPGWCQGVGNPHNTVENCGYSASDRSDDRGRYDDRTGGYPNVGGGSYELEHQDFHRYLDRKYSDLAARRPTDIQYQLQLRMEKSAEHNRWHEQVGTRH